MTARQAYSTFAESFMGRWLAAFVMDAGSEPPESE